MNKARANPAIDVTAMAKGLARPGVRTDSAASRVPAPAVDWRQRMSDNIAYALLVYTALQIIRTLTALQASGTGLLPYLALVVLVVGIIPACRLFERRWSQLGDEASADPDQSARFHHDQRLLWALAVSLPFAITGVFLLLCAL